MLPLLKPVNRISFRLLTCGLQISRTIYIIADTVLGFLPRQTWPGHAPEGPGKKFDFLSLVTGHWYSYRKPELTEVLATYFILG
jgi:hypothetical protein